MREAASTRRLLLTIGLGVLVVVGVLLFVQRERQIYKTQERVAVNQTAVAVQALLEKTVGENVPLATSLEAYVRLNDGDIDQETFEVIAAELSRERPEVRSLQLAPNGVVTYVVPREGNEAAIGYDLLREDYLKNTIKKAITDNQYVVAGPVELVQGGRALILRNPIYLPQSIDTVLSAYSRTDFGAFWGFATILIDFDSLIASFSEVADAGEFNVAIRGRDGLGEEGILFWGDETVFEQDPVIKEVVLPAGAWQVGVIPAAGWSRRSPLELFFLVMGLGILLLASLLIWKKRAT